MTDNEIIKALECASYYDCDKCPHHQENCDDRIADQYELSKDALDLINRLQAEIERLKAENKYLEYHLYCECSTNADLASIIAEEMVGEE